MANTINFKEFMGQFLENSSDFVVLIETLIYFKDFVGFDELEETSRTFVRINTSLDLMKYNRFT